MVQALLAALGHGSDDSVSTAANRARWQAGHMRNARLIKSLLKVGMHLLVRTVTDLRIRALQDVLPQCGGAIAQLIILLQVVVWKPTSERPCEEHVLGCMGVIIAFRTLVCPDSSIGRLFGPGWPHLLHFGRVEKLIFWHLVHSQSWGAWTASWTCSACTDTRLAFNEAAQITMIFKQPHSTAESDLPMLVSLQQLGAWQQPLLWQPCLLPPGLDCPWPHCQCVKTSEVVPPLIGMAMITSLIQQ